MPVTVGNFSYGIRKDIIVKIKDVLDGIVLRPGPPPLLLKMANTFIDPFDEISQLPKGCVVPDPETIRVGLFGVTKDRNMRISILAFAVDKPLFDIGEDIITAIVNTLTDQINADSFVAMGFSIVNIGPISHEQFEIKGEFVYIAIPISVQFLLDQS